MISKGSFEVIAKKLELDSSKKIDYMQVVIMTEDCGGKSGSSDTSEPAVYFTDVMLQGGTVATSWVGHVSEIRWSFDNA